MFSGFHLTQIYSNQQSTEEVLGELNASPPPQLAKHIDHLFSGLASLTLLSGGSRSQAKFHQRYRERGARNTRKG